ncbi:ribosomal protein S18 acetylase RimI-like enzyme [Pullulanibacillus pueri]|uniref:N-acetyltransferase domain-containing protein n=1 Tax=Pullulanibacillus pueri TaxID=1437324 RepID=A0A8J2ZTI1_9BACL|nr:GNAT family N-acetyltransferase [Pullulanibacillus pueri]MBM7681129.1 ribosomal protein S18 acetylase RimI-like enzyme [Pullulanibacillus pueri]GGH77157.1 hypothetical protein GCM10007096_08640 [Pullulanibacillus pueri]
MKLVPVKDIEKQKLTDFFRKHWGSPEMVISTGIYQCDTLDGFAAMTDNNHIIGLITYILREKECEIISLDSLEENKGIGTRLMAQVEREVRLKGCQTVKLVTTNDNLHAVGFYQKRGFKIVGIFVNAVEKARKIKPQIPQVADNGIPICDELLLKKQL